jgi:hypothetical protein
MSHIPNAAMPHADTKHEDEHAAKHEHGAHHEHAAKQDHAAHKGEQGASAASRAVDIGAWVALGLGLGAGTVAVVQRLAHRTEGEKATPKRKRKGD